MAVANAIAPVVVIRLLLPILNSSNTRHFGKISANAMAPISLTPL